ncbi:MAG: ribose-phosphate diphosphokinase [Actinobacteria bacterium]|nr:ribose-phosphate diphosphokinase [Actinomycetota bacterium]
MVLLVGEDASGGDGELTDGDDVVDGHLRDVDLDRVGNGARSGGDLDLSHLQVDKAVVHGDLLRLTEEDHRHAHGDLNVEVHLEEVDVAHGAAHRVALHFLDDRWVHRAVDGQVENGVDARGARQGGAQVAAVDGDADRRHAEAVDDGGDAVLAAEPTGGGATGHVVEAKEVIGDVAGRLCILTDDMIDTGGTIVSAAEILLDRGATEVWAMATHGVLSGPAVDRLKNSPIARVVLTNTLPLPEEKQLPQIEVLSIAPLIAEALSAVFDDTSVSEIFSGENYA